MSAAPKPREDWGSALLTVKRIVEAHGGEVGVRSTAGQGSLFWFESVLGLWSLGRGKIQHADFLANRLQCFASVHLQFCSGRVRMRDKRASVRSSLGAIDQRI